jgi:hypothetical protein|tara:strand:+ start:965 stop:1159 length:195 start_codon:yes stop_codon:yes gene_type:complete
MSQNRKEELYEVYREKFGVQDVVSCSLRKEFDQMMLLKYEMMPYWFVCKLIELGIDINEEEELF